MRPSRWRPLGLQPRCMFNQDAGSLPNPPGGRDRAKPDFAHNRRGGGGHKHPTTKRGFCKKEAPIHKFVFANVTSLSDKAEAWFAMQTADFKGTNEIHQNEEKLARTIARLDRLGGHNWFCSPAEGSDKSDKGTFGGTLLGATTVVKQTPLHDHHHFQGAFWNNGGVHLCGVQCGIRGGTVQVYMGYHKDGPNKAIFETLARNTGGGRNPFIFMGDFNADSSHEQVLDWACRLGAVIVIPPSGTCISKGHASTIDYIMISHGLESLLTEMSVDYAVPFSPHAAVRFGMRMDLDFCMVTVERIPRRLPEPLANQPLTDEIWGQAKEFDAKRSSVKPFFGGQLLTRDFWRQAWARALPQLGWGFACGLGLWRGKRLS